jgi:hypothetical protein
MINSKIEEDKLENTKSIKDSMAPHLTMNIIKIITKMTITGF